MIDLIDAFVARVPVPSGTTRDTTCAEPRQREPETLYGYGLPESFIPDGGESIDRNQFTVALEITVESTEDDENDRDAMVALAAAVEPITDWVRDNRQDHVNSPSLWDALQARVMWPGLRGLGWRSVRIELAGYRFLGNVS